jgi:hypothetical protein
MKVLIPHTYSNNLTAVINIKQDELYAQMGRGWQYEGSLMQPIFRVASAENKNINE